ncbi:MAG: hydantoinase/oxoprolinase family protein, partial [Dehalococcoidia bacterium]
ISFDMGGTSTDVSLITEHGVSATLNGKLGQWPMQLPMLDIETIGAGGGSIAWLSPSGNLAVGPRSAGASPGPACYGQGGSKPTVTDANLVLGRIGTSLAGGQLDLDRAAAQQAIEERIAQPLNLEVYRAANGVLQIVNHAMMGAIRNVSVERGYDPRDFALIAFGGAGPMHAIELARLMHLPVVVAPRNPGIASAFGLLVSELKNDYARTLIQKPPGYDFELMNQVYRELEREGLRWLEAEQVPESDRSLTRSADLRYAHQGFEVSVDLGPTQLDADTLETLLQSFHEKHRQLFGFSLDQGVEIVTLRVTALGHLRTAGLPELEGNFSGPEQAIVGRRPVYFDEMGGFVDCNLYERKLLGPHSKVQGPAILQGSDSTVVINPGWGGSIDRYGNCVLRPGEA